LQGWIQGKIEYLQFNLHNNSDSQNVLFLQNRLADFVKTVKWQDITRLLHLAVKYSRNKKVSEEHRKKTEDFIENVLFPAIKVHFKFTHIRIPEFLAITNILLGFKSSSSYAFLNDFFDLSSKSLLITTTEEFTKVAGLLLSITKENPELEEHSKTCLGLLEGRYTFGVMTI
jgi:hypothetical protein